MTLRRGHPWGATLLPICSQNRDKGPRQTIMAVGLVAAQDVCGRYWDRTSDLSGVNGALSR